MSTSRLKALLVGLAAGLLLNASQKALEIMMLGNFFSVLHAGLSLFLLAWGAARPGTDGRPGAARTVALGTLAVLVLAASLWNRDFTTLALGSAIYYPVPLPRSGVLNQISLLVTMLALPACFWPLGTTLAGLAARPTVRGRSVFPPFLAGLAAGVSVVYLFGTLGPFLWLAAGLALWAALLLPPLPAVATAAALAVAFGLYHQFPQRRFFSWGITDYEYLGGGFGRDVKVDFLSFRDGECLGTVIDNVMMTCECKDPNWIPVEYDHVVRALLGIAKDESESGAMRKKDLDVLDVGRSGGGNSRALELHSGPNRNRAVEFDPAIARRLLARFTDFNQGVYARPESRVYTGDFRTVLERLADEGQRFDHIFFSGIGTKTYLLPRSYVFAEHFLLTAEGSTLVFDRLLKPGGVFYLDWGTSDTRESRYFVAGFPDDVATLVYWATQSQYPFSGSPQVHVIASRDRARIDAIAKRLARLTDFLPVDFRPGLAAFRTTDDRPFLQPDLHWMITRVHLFLLAPTALALAAFLRRARRATGVGFRAGAGPALAGMTAGFAESLAAAHNPLVAAPWGIPAWSAQHGLFLLALAAGAAVGRPGRRHWAGLVLAPMAIAAGLLVLLALPERAVALAGAPLAGAGFGFLAVSLLTDRGDQGSAGGLACFLVGGAIALLVFQIPFFLGGYRTCAWIVAALAIVLAVAASRVGTPEDE